MLGTQSCSKFDTNVDCRSGSRGAREPHRQTLQRRGGDADSPVALGTEPTLGTEPVCGTAERLHLPDEFLEAIVGALDQPDGRSVAKLPGALSGRLYRVEELLPPLCLGGDVTRADDDFPCPDQAERAAASAGELLRGAVAALGDVEGMELAEEAERPGRAEACHQDASQPAAGEAPQQPSENPCAGCITASGPAGERSG